MGWGLDWIWVFFGLQLCYWMGCMISLGLIQQQGDYRMRRSIEVNPNPALKGLNSIFPTLPSIPQNTILKLSQNSKQIYTRYIPSPTCPPNKAYLPSKLLQLYNIKPTTSMQIQPTYNITVCKKLQVFVSKLDWLIISNQASSLEVEFMNQVEIVWDRAVIPLYYDQRNCVVLTVRCDGVGYLQENSELQVLQYQQESTKQKEQKDKDYTCYEVTIIPVSLLPSGNINKIYIPKTHNILIPPPQPQIPTQTTPISQSHPQTPTSPTPQQSPLPLPIPISTPLQKIKQNYVFQLLYSQKCQDKIFPCDTDVLSVKDQMKEIARMKGAVSGGGNGDKGARKDLGKVYKLVVQVEVVDDVDMAIRDYQAKIGKELKTHKYTKQPIKQQQPINQQPSKQQPNPIQQQNNIQQPQLPKYQAHTPLPPQPQPQQQQQQPPNTILLNQILIIHFNIDLNQPLKLRRRSVSDQMRNSKKLEYLLAMKEFWVGVGVAHGEDSEKCEEDLRQGVVQDIVTKLANPNHDGNGNSLTIYSRIPYAFKSPLNKTPKFAYITLQQNQTPLNDPLTIYHTPSQSSPSPKHKPNTKSPKQMQQKIEEVDPIREIREKLGRVVKIQNYFYKGDGDQDAKVRVMVGVLRKLEGICWNSRQSTDHPQMGGKSAHQIFTQLYKVCYQQQIQKLLQLLPKPSSSSPSISPSSSPFTPILLTSFSNNGKTVLNKILRHHSYQTLYIDMSQLDNPSFLLSNVIEYLELVFQLYDGDLLFFDNFDAVCYRVQEGDLHRRMEMVAGKVVCRRVLEFGKVYNRVCVFTAKNEANIDSQFQNYQLIKLKNPNRQTRSQVLTTHLQTNKTLNLNLNPTEILQNSQSMSFGQFSKYIISGHKAEGAGQNSKLIDFSKLAGIKEAKKILRTIVERPLKYSFVFRKLPVKLSRGVLLYGGSGVGKSAIGEALAGEFKMKFFSVKGSDILSKYIGGSEAAVRDIFEKAMTVSPSIIFFDEFQSIVPRRNASNTSVTDRVVNQFLCYLDGVASVQGVYIVAASSRPQLIDPALLRPGRIDTHIFLDHPTQQQRQQLLCLYSNSISFQTPIQQLLDLTEHYSYSDLIGLIKQLRIKQSARVIRENLDLMDARIDAREFKVISDSFLREVIGGYKVALSKAAKMKEREAYLAFKRGDVQDIKNQKTIQY